MHDESDWFTSPQPLTGVEPPRVAVYHVPERFGISAILALMTLLSILFGALRWMNVPEEFYVMFGTLVLVICLVQMRWGQVPREASIAAGAVVLPVMTVVLVSEGRAEILLATPCVAIAGAACGYLAGALVAGVFLLLDQLDRWWRHRHDEVVVAEVIDKR